MFGLKLRSWMEAHIVLRPRKKRSKDAKDAKEGAGVKGSKGGGCSTMTLPDPPAKSALVDPNPSPGAANHNSGPPKRVTLVSPTPSCRVSHQDRGNSPRRPLPLPNAASGGGHPRGVGGGGISPACSGNGTRYSTYLSSPESAYSTGYSTDATSPHGYSPGTSLPPEYYINLRTGTRYFQSAERQQQQLQNYPHGAPSTSEEWRGAGGSGVEAPRMRFGHQRTLSNTPAPVPAPVPAGVASVQQQQHHHPYCRHTVAKVTCTTLEEGGFSYGAPVPQRHRRAESVDVSTSSGPRGHVTIRTSFAQVEEVTCSPHRLLQPPSQRAGNVSLSPVLGCGSPRQRSRIKTNPWMSTNSTTATSGNTGTTGSSSAAEKMQWTTSSSCSDIAPTPRSEEVSTAATAGSWRLDDGHTTPTTTTADEEEQVTSFRRPRRRPRGGDSSIKSPPRRGSLSSEEGTHSSHTSSPPSSPRRSPSSEDLTLNEMGRFDESYVYEKETDILSDSDPTDCGEDDEQDYHNGNLTDRHSSNDFLDMSYQNGLDNASPCRSRTTLDDDDELDFIDNGPLDVCEPVVRVNTGHCTYYHVPEMSAMNNNNNNNIILPPRNFQQISPPQQQHRPKRATSKRRESSKRQSSARSKDDNTSPPRRASHRKSRSASCNRRNRRELKEGSNSGQVTPRLNRQLRDVRALADMEGSYSGPPTPSARQNRQLRDIKAFVKAEVHSGPPTPTARHNRQLRDVRLLAEAEGSSSGQATPTARSTNSTPLVNRKPRLAPSPIERSTTSPDCRSADKTNRNSAKFYANFVASEAKLIEADKEADRKYQQLIMEAETLLVRMKSVSFEEEDEILEIETPTVENPPRPFPQVTSQVQEVTKVTEVTRHTQTSPPCSVRNRPDTTALHLQVLEPNTPAGAASTAPTVTPAPIPRRRGQQSVVSIQVTTPSGGPPRELVTFRSVDLSSPVAAEAPYCPQSEPLKRKVYTPAALNRLQQHLALADCAESSDSSPPDDDETSAQDRLGQKVAALRRERLAAEARLANREEERRKRREAREKARAEQQLAVDRRNNLLSTLESLKRDLQCQSASLHDVYNSITDLRSPNAENAQRSLLPSCPPPSFGPGFLLQDKPRCDFLSPIRRASSLRSPGPPPKPPPRRCC